MNNHRTINISAPVCLMAGVCTKRVPTRKESILVLGVSFITCLLINFYGPGVFAVFNDAVPSYDANIYHIIGRSWMNGVIPYKELSDIKGPFIFLIYGISSLMTPTSFVGVSIVSALWCAVALLFIYYLARLFFNISVSCALLVLSLLWFLSKSNPSDYIVTLQMVSLFWCIKNVYEREEQRFTMLQLCVTGVFVAFTLAMKYNLSAFWVPLVPVMAWYGEKGLIRSLLAFLSGMLLVIAPLVIYFYSVGALHDLWEEYVITSLCYAAGTDEEAALQTLGWQVFKHILPLSLSKIPVFAPLVGGILVFSGVGCLWITSPSRKGKIISAALLCSIIISMVAIFGGAHVYGHYYASFLPYVILTFVLSAWLWGTRVPLGVKRVSCIACYSVPTLLIALFSAKQIYEYESMRSEDGASKRLMNETCRELSARLGSDSFIVVSGMLTHFYRLQNETPPIKHFVAQMTPNGGDIQLEEIVNCLKSNPPKYLVTNQANCDRIKGVLNMVSPSYRQVELSHATEAWQGAKRPLLFERVD